MSVSPRLDSGPTFGWGESLTDRLESPASVEELGDALMEVGPCEGVEEVGFLLGD